MTIERSTLEGRKDLVKIGALGEEIISRFAVRGYFGESLLIGMNIQQKKVLFQRSEGDLKPKLESGKSSTFSIGYRFGGKAKGSMQTKGSKKIDPPGFGVCPPKWNAGC